MIMMTTIARGLQLLGLALPIAGVLLAEGGAQPGQAMTFEFGFLVAGAALFYVGWRLQRRGTS